MFRTSVVLLVVLFFASCATLPKKEIEDNSLAIAEISSDEYHGDLTLQNTDTGRSYNSSYQKDGFVFVPGLPPGQYIIEEISCITIRGRMTAKFENGLIRIYANEFPPGGDEFILQRAPMQSERVLPNTLTKPFGITESGTYFLGSVRIITETFGYHWKVKLDSSAQELPFLEKILGTRDLEQSGWELKNVIGLTNIFKTGDGEF